MLKRYGIAALAAVLAVLSCTHREESGIQKVKFQAVQADGPSTKTVLQADGSVFWSPGDAVSLFYGGATIQKTKLTAENTSAAAQTTFSGVLDGFLPDGSTSFWAVYPYAAETAFDGSAVTVTVPAEQTAVAGTFASDAFVSIATSKDYTLQFYNLCGGIKFSVANQGIQSVIFKGNNNEILAGQLQAAFDENGRPVVTEVVKGAMELVLNAPEGGFEVGKWYYMVSLPTTLSAGYTMTFLDAAGGLVAERVTDSSISIKRAVWGRLTEADNVGPEEGSIIYYTTSDGNIVEYYTHPEYPVDISVVSNTYEDGIGMMIFDKPVTSISYHAFSGKSTLTSITLPETVTSIDEEAFSSCTSLAWPDIPESVTQIGPGAFYGCDAFVSVIIPDSVLEFGPNIFQACSNLESITCQFATADGKCLIIDGVLNSVASVGLPDEYTFPDDVAVVGHSALRNNRYTGRLVFGDNLLSVEKEAFAYAYYIKSIELGESLESVSDGAFIMCGADSLILPATLATIGKEAFAASFDYLKFLSTTPPEASGLIFETQGNSGDDFPVFVPAESVDAYKTAEYWSAYADRIHPIGGESPITASKYLTFTSEGTTKLSLANFNNNAPVLYYSTDAQNWTQWDYSELTFSANAPLYICGDNPNGFSDNSTILYSTFVTSGSNFAVSGSIMSLLDKDVELDTIPSNSSFGYLFNGCTGLTSAPSLPATTLTMACYQQMFKGCSSLKDAPELPATTLAVQCYQEMFFDCSSLTSAPVLPATIMAQQCYDQMFYGCTSLETAPELPATTLANYCYQAMFGVCTSLAAAPELPATALNVGCYSLMFTSCSSLGSAPVLPAATLEELCYSGMFSDCSELSYVKCLATDISASKCLNNWLGAVADTGVFVKAPDVAWPEGASGIPTGWEVEVDGESTITASKYLTFTSTGTTTVSLTNEEGNAPVLYYSTDAQNWTQWDYSGLTFTEAAPLYICGDNPDGFSSGSSIFSTFSATGDFFSISGDIMSLVNKDEDLTTVWSYWFYKLFSGCSLLKEGPSLPASKVSNRSYYGLFENCTNLLVAPELPATILGESCYSGMFAGCTSLTTAPALPATSLAGSCYSTMFRGCSNLTVAPVLPATIAVQNCYSWMFSDCSSLINAPELPATTLEHDCYNHMFSGCTSLSAAPNLPAVELESACYFYMFDGCTNMSVAPELLSSTLVSNCYLGMFYNCSKIDYIKCLATDISANGCLSSWVKGVSSTGTFVKSADVQWPTGESGIPTGWEIEVEQSITASKYLTFTSTGTTTVSLTNEEGNAPVLYYSTDAQNWTQWDYSGLTFTGAAPLYICGDNPDGFSFSLNPDKISTFVATGDPFSVSGDIMSLVKMDGDRDDIPYPGCFKNLFRGCTLLTSAPTLTATILTGGCYTSMFSGCTGLTVAPELPATTLQTYCYAQMFEGCTSLTVAPELSATSLDYGCYSGMFWGCESLTTAPALPATTLAEYCYENMFYGCTNLTEAPELPATTLTTQCYQVMFADCTSLSAAPELPATNLASGCYNMMFSGCISLEEAPELPATTLASNCYWDMFANCTSLTSAPTLPAATLPAGAYGQMFHGCSNLSFVTCLATDISASDCLYNWLYGVSDTGTFVKSPNIQWPSGTSGIPDGWTVQDAEAVDLDGRWEALRNNDDPTSVAFVALFEGSNLDLYIIAWGQHYVGTYQYADGAIVYTISEAYQAYTDVTATSHSWEAGNLDASTLTLSDGYDWYQMDPDTLANYKEDLQEFSFLLQDGNNSATSALFGLDIVFTKVN